MMEPVFQKSISRGSLKDFTVPTLPAAARLAAAALGLPYRSTLSKCMIRQFMCAAKLTWGAALDLHCSQRNTDQWNVYKAFAKKFQIKTMQITAPLHT